MFSFGKSSSGRSRPGSEISTNSKSDRRRDKDRDTDRDKERDQDDDDDVSVSSRRRRSKHKDSTSSSSKRKSTLRDEVDADEKASNSGFNPQSSSYSSTSRAPYAGVAAPSVASSNATARPGATPSRYEPPELVRNDSMMDRSVRGSGAKEQSRDSERRSSRREDNGSKPERRRTDDDYDGNKRSDPSRRSTYDENSDNRRRDSKRSSRDDRNANKENTRALDSHDAALPQNQFFSDPTTYTEPYRPPGQAAEYYGDHGESVQFQPGVRPQGPGYVINQEYAHLQTPSTEAKPPPEPSTQGQVGANASFFAGGSSADEMPSQNHAPSSSGKPPSHAQSSASMRPPKPSDPYLSEGSARTSPAPNGRIPFAAVGAAAAGAGLAASYFNNAEDHSTPQRPPNTSQSQHNVTNSTVSGTMNYGYSGAHNDATSYPPPPSDYGPSPNANNTQSGSHNYGGIAAAATGLAAAGGAAYLAHQHQHTDQDAYHQSSTQEPTGQGRPFVLGQNQSAFPAMKQRQRQKRRGVMGRLSDWWRDPNGVAEFEEYSEYIGVCRYCFDPQSNPGDAPRKHHYHGRNWRPPPGYMGNKNYSSSRVDKAYRQHYSSDEDRRKRSSTAKRVAGAALGAVGAAKLGETLRRSKHDFDDTYSVRTGQELQQPGPSRVNYSAQGDLSSYRQRLSRHSSNEDVRLERKTSTRRDTNRRHDDLSSARKTRRRASSSSDQGLSRGAAFSVGAGAAALGVAAEAAHRRRSRSRSRSRDRKSSRPKLYYSKRVSPRHSYVDLSRTQSGGGGVGSFFSSPSANQRKGKKPKGFFNFGNDSSSSSDADLAFGEGTVLRRKSSGKMYERDGRDKRSRRKESGGKVDGDTAAIMGLAAAGAALAAESDRSNRDKGKSKRRETDRNSRLRYGNEPDRYEQKIALEDHTTDGENDDAWEDATDDNVSVGSIDTALAYGGRASAAQSRESLATDKWAWRWKKNQAQRDEKAKRRRQSMEDLSAGPAAPAAQDYFEKPPQAPDSPFARKTSQNYTPFLAGAVATGLGAAAVAASELQHEPSPGTVVPLRNVDPVPYHSPQMPESFASASRVDLQQPQPVSAPAIQSEYVSKIESKADAGMALAEDASAYDRERRPLVDFAARRSRLSELREDSPDVLVNPSTMSKNNVTFDLTEEQLSNIKRAEEKEERQRRRRERQEKRQTIDGSELVSRMRQSEERQDYRPEQQKRPRSSSVDDPASSSSKLADIDQELAALKSGLTQEQLDRLEEKRKKREKDKKRRAEAEETYRASNRSSKDEHDTISGVATAAIAAGVGVAAATALTGRDRDRSSSEEKRSRKKSESSNSPVDEAKYRTEDSKPSMGDQQQRIARMAAKRVRSASPVNHSYEDYSTFFTPVEIAEHVQEHNKTSRERNASPHGARHRDEVGAHIVEITPDSFSQVARTQSHPFDDELYEPFGFGDDHDPHRYPWKVPRLGLVEPTPPGSVGHYDDLAARSPLDPSRQLEHAESLEDDVADIGEPLVRKTSTGSKVTFGDPAIWLYEDITPEYEVANPSETYEQLDRVKTLPDDVDEDEFAKQNDNRPSPDAESFYKSAASGTAYVLEGAVPEPEQYYRPRTERVYTLDDNDKDAEEAFLHREDASSRRERERSESPLRPVATTSSSVPFPTSIPYDGPSPEITPMEELNRTLSSSSVYQGPFVETVSDIDLSRSQFGTTLGTGEATSQVLPDASTDRAGEHGENLNARDSADVFPSQSGDVSRPSRSEMRRVERAMSSGDDVKQISSLNDRTSTRSLPGAFDVSDSPEDQPSPAAEASTAPFDRREGAQQEQNPFKAAMQAAAAAAAVAALAKTSSGHASKSSSSKPSLEEELADPLADFRDRSDPGQIKFPLPTGPKSRRQDGKEYGSDPEEWEKSSTISRKSKAKSEIEPRPQKKSEINAEGKAAGITAASAAIASMLARRASAPISDDALELERETRRSKKAKSAQTSSSTVARDETSEQPTGYVAEPQSYTDDAATVMTSQEREPDFYSGEYEKPRRRQSKRSSQSFDDYDGRSVTSLPATKDESERSKRRSKSGSGTQDADTNESRRSTRRSTVQDADIGDDMESDTRSVVSTPSGKEKRKSSSRRSSARGAEGIKDKDDDDDTRSVKSTPSRSGSKSDRKSPKDGKGGFFAFFSGGKSDVSSSSKKSTKSSKSEPSTPHRDKERRRSGSRESKLSKKRESRSRSEVDDDLETKSTRQTFETHTDDDKLDEDKDLPPNASTDDGFVSAEDTQPSFLVARPEVPQPPLPTDTATSTEMSMGTDGASGLKKHNHDEEAICPDDITVSDDIFVSDKEAEDTGHPQSSADNQRRASVSQAELIIPLLDRPRALSTTNISDHSHVGTAASPTAVPLSFFRKGPFTPRAGRDATSSPIATPHSPLTPRPRQTRPKSTEFNSREVRPLYLLERHTPHKDADFEMEPETLPSLPSSRTTSANPSTENLRQLVSEMSTEDSQVPAVRGESARRNSWQSGDGDNSERRLSADYLDSRSATPVPGDKQRPREEMKPENSHKAQADIAQKILEHRERMEAQKYLFHSPSELLQDPSDFQPPAQGEAVDLPIEPRVGSPLPSVVSTNTDHDDNYMSAESRAGSPGIDLAASRTPSPFRGKVSDSISARTAALFGGAAAAGVGLGVALGRSRSGSRSRSSSASRSRSKVRPSEGESEKGDVVMSADSRSYLPESALQLSTEVQPPIAIIEPTPVEGQPSITVATPAKDGTEDERSPPASSAQPLERAQHATTADLQPREVSADDYTSDDSTQTRRRAQSPPAAIVDDAIETARELEQRAISPSLQPAETGDLLSLTDRMQDGHEAEFTNESLVQDTEHDGKLDDEEPEPMARSDIGRMVEQRPEVYVPTDDELNNPDSKLGAFQLGYERAVRTRGLANGVTREQALQYFLPRRDNAPFMPKANLTPIDQSPASSRVESPRQSNDQLNIVSVGSQGKKARREKKKGKKGSSGLRQSYSSDGETPRSSNELLSTDNDSRDLVANSSEAAQIVSSVALGVALQEVARKHDNAEVPPAPTDSSAEKGTFVEAPVRVSTAHEDQKSDVIGVETLGDEASLQPETPLEAAESDSVQRGLDKAQLTSLMQGPDTAAADYMVDNSELVTPLEKQIDVSELAHVSKGEVVKDRNSTADDEATDSLQTDKHIADNAVKPESKHLSDDAEQEKDLTVDGTFVSRSGNVELDALDDGTRAAGKSADTAELEAETSDRSQQESTLAATEDKALEAASQREGNDAAEAAIEYPTAVLKKSKKDKKGKRKSGTSTAPLDDDESTKIEPAPALMSMDSLVGGNNNSNNDEALGTARELSLADEPANDSTVREEATDFSQPTSDSKADDAISLVNAVPWDFGLTAKQRKKKEKDLRSSGQWKQRVTQEAIDAAIEETNQSRPSLDEEIRKDEDQLFSEDTRHGPLTGESEDMKSVAVSEPAGEDILVAWDHGLSSKQAKKKEKEMRKSGTWDSRLTQEMIDTAVEETDQSRPRLDEDVHKDKDQVFSENLSYGPLTGNSESFKSVAAAEPAEDDEEVQDNLVAWDYGLSSKQAKKKEKDMKKQGTWDSRLTQDMIDARTSDAAQIFDLSEDLTVSGDKANAEAPQDFDADPQLDHSEANEGGEEAQIITRDAGKRGLIADGDEQTVGDEKIAGKESEALNDISPHQAWDHGLNKKDRKKREKEMRANGTWDHRVTQDMIDAAVLAPKELTVTDETEYRVTEELAGAETAGDDESTSVTAEDLWAAPTKKSKKDKKKRKSSALAASPAEESETPTVPTAVGDESEPVTAPTSIEKEPGATTTPASAEQEPEPFTAPIPIEVSEPGTAHTSFDKSSEKKSLPRDLDFVQPDDSVVAHSEVAEQQLQRPDESDTHPGVSSRHQEVATEKVKVKVDDNNAAPEFEGMSATPQQLAQPTDERPHVRSIAAGKVLEEEATAAVTPLSKTTESGDSKTENDLNENDEDWGDEAIGEQGRNAQPDDTIEQFLSDSSKPRDEDSSWRKGKKKGKQKKSKRGSSVSSVPSESATMVIDDSLARSTTTDAGEEANDLKLSTTISGEDEKHVSGVVPGADLDDGQSEALTTPGAVSSLATPYERSIDPFDEISTSEQEFSKVLAPQLAESEDAIAETPSETLAETPFETEGEGAESFWTTGQSSKVKKKKKRKSVVWADEPSAPGTPASELEMIIPPSPEEADRAEAVKEVQLAEVDAQSRTADAAEPGFTEEDAMLTKETGSADDIDGQPKTSNVPMAEVAASDAFMKEDVLISAASSKDVEDENNFSSFTKKSKKNKRDSLKAFSESPAAAEQENNLSSDVVVAEPPSSNEAPAIEPSKQSSDSEKQDPKGDDWTNFKTGKRSKKDKKKSKRLSSAFTDVIDEPGPVEQGQQQIEDERLDNQPEPTDSVKDLTEKDKRQDSNTEDQANKPDADEARDIGEHAENDDTQALTATDQPPDAKETQATQVWDELDDVRKEPAGEEWYVPVVKNKKDKKEKAYSKSSDLSSDGESRSPKMAGGMKPVQGSTAASEPASHSAELYSDNVVAQEFPDGHEVTLRHRPESPLAMESLGTDVAQPLPHNRGTETEKAQPELTVDDSTAVAEQQKQVHTSSVAATETNEVSQEEPAQVIEARDLSLPEVNHAEADGPESFYRHPVPVHNTMDEDMTMDSSYGRDFDARGRGNVNRSTSDYAVGPANDLPMDDPEDFYRIAQNVPGTYEPLTGEETEASAVPQSTTAVDDSVTTIKDLSEDAEKTPSQSTADQATTETLAESSSDKPSETIIAAEPVLAEEKMSEQAEPATRNQDPPIADTEKPPSEQDLFASFSTKKSKKDKKKARRPMAGAFTDDSSPGTPADEMDVDELSILPASVTEADQTRETSASGEILSRDARSSKSALESDNLRVLAEEESVPSIELVSDVDKTNLRGSQAPIDFVETPVEADVDQEWSVPTKKAKDKKGKKGKRKSVAESSNAKASVPPAADFEPESEPAPVADTPDVEQLLATTEELADERQIERFRDIPPAETKSESAEAIVLEERRESLHQTEAGKTLETDNKLPEDTMEQTPLSGESIENPPVHSSNISTDEVQLSTEATPDEWSVPTKSKKDKKNKKRKGSDKLTTEEAAVPEDSKTLQDSTAAILPPVLERELTAEPTEYDAQTKAEIFDVPEDAIITERPSRDVVVDAKGDEHAVLGRERVEQVSSLPSMDPNNKLKGQETPKRDLPLTDKEDENFQLEGQSPDVQAHKEDNVQSDIDVPTASGDSEDVWAFTTKKSTRKDKKKKRKSGLSTPIEEETFETSRDQPDHVRTVNKAEEDLVLDKALTTETNQTVDTPTEQTIVDQQDPQTIDEWSVPMKKSKKDKKKQKKRQSEVEELENSAPPYTLQEDDVAAESTSMTRADEERTNEKDDLQTSFVMSKDALQSVDESVNTVPFEHQDSSPRDTTQHAMKVDNEDGGEVMTTLRGEKNNMHSKIGSEFVGKNVVEDAPSSVTAPAEREDGKANREVVEIGQDEMGSNTRKGKKDKKKKNPRSAPATEEVPEVHGSERLEDSALTAKELHEEPKHQQFLADLHEKAADFRPVPEVDDSKRLQDVAVTAKELHEEPQHQEFLADLHEKVADFPPVPTADVATRDIEMSDAPAPREQLANESDFKDVDIFDDPARSRGEKVAIREERGLSSGKSKGGKKKKQKSKPSIFEDDAQVDSPGEERSIGLAAATTDENLAPSSATDTRRPSITGEAFTESPVEASKLRDHHAHNERGDRDATMEVETKRAVSAIPENEPEDFYRAFLPSNKLEDQGGPGRELAPETVGSHNVDEESASRDIHPAEDSDGSNISETTRARRRRKGRSSPTWQEREPDDLDQSPRSRALTPPPDHDDIMDTALGIAAGLGIGATQSGRHDAKPSQRDTGSHSPPRRQRSAEWSFGGIRKRPESVRDSGVHIEPEREARATRDSGYAASPLITVHADQREEGLRPPRPRSPTSSSEDVHRHHSAVNRHVDTQFTPGKETSSPASEEHASRVVRSSPAIPSPKTPYDQVIAEIIPLPGTERRNSSLRSQHGNSIDNLRAASESPRQTRSPRTSGDLSSNLLDRVQTAEVQHREVFSPSPNPEIERAFSPKTPLQTIDENGLALGAVAVGLAGGAAMMARDSGDPSRRRSLGKSKSRTSSLRQLRASTSSPFEPNPDLNPPSQLPITSNVDEERGRGATMDNVYDGYGAAPGSPRSPTRPPSIKKRQSLQQISDLQARVDQLANENRQLAEQKLMAERHIEDLHMEHTQNDHATEEALSVVNIQLRQRDEEIAKLKAEIEDLIRARDAARDEHDQKYTLLLNAKDQAHAQYQEASRDLDDLRQQHTELSGGMEGLVQTQIDAALAAKSAECEKLRQQLDQAKAEIRELHQQIVASGADRVLVVLDEDYFEDKCQKLCHHVQQWVLRFSKFSDTRLCRRTDEVKDEEVVDRFDNTVLDGSDVDTYLADRVKRRDVFMSVVMSLIFNYIFTRYIFGMDRDERQKLKVLEKQLAEVGPADVVHEWRAVTLTLLAKRPAFKTQLDIDTEAVADEILRQLSEFLPPPKNLRSQIFESLQNVVALAAKLSIEMRQQKAEYIMLPPLLPEYDTNGDLAHKVYFNANLMNERSGETTSNDELEQAKAVVRIVLFPLVLRKNDDAGDIVVSPAQVLVARADKGKRPKSRIASGGSERERAQSRMSANISAAAASTHSLGAMSGIEGNVI